MIPYERQQKILSYIEDKEIVKIDELQELFEDVSVSTLRRDLKELEKSRKVEILSGGAVKKISTIGEISITTRSTYKYEEKEKIAALAADLIHDGDTIYLDSGSTCSILFKKIKEKRITIYTSNMDIFALSGDINAEIIVLGGKFNPINSSLTGPFTEELLNKLYFTKSFLGVNGINERMGVTTPTIEEATKKKLVKEHSEQTYLLCDSSKFHKLSNVKAFELENLVIISDCGDDKIEESVLIIS